MGELEFEIFGAWKNNGQELVETDDYDAADVVAIRKADLDTIKLWNRVFIEKTNKEKGLQPRKERNGYRLLKVEDLKTGDDGRTVYKQRVTVETPYPPMALSRKELFDMVQRDLPDICTELHIISERTGKPMYDDLRVLRDLCKPYYLISFVTRGEVNPTEKIL